MLTKCEIPKLNNFLICIEIYILSNIFMKWIFYEISMKFLWGKTKK